MTINIGPSFSLTCRSVKGDIRHTYYYPPYKIPSTFFIIIICPRPPPFQKSEKKNSTLEPVTLPDANCYFCKLLTSFKHGHDAGGCAVVSMRRHGQERVGYQRHDCYKTAAYHEQFLMCFTASPNTHTRRIVLAHYFPSSKKDVNRHSPVSLR